MTVLDRMDESESQQMVEEMACLRVEVSLLQKKLGKAERSPQLVVDNEWSDAIAMMCPDEFLQLTYTDQNDGSSSPELIWQLNFSNKEKGSIQKKNHNLFPLLQLSIEGW